MWALKRKPVRVFSFSAVATFLLFREKVDWDEQPLDLSLTGKAGLG